MQSRHSEGPGEPAPSGIPSWEEVRQRAYRLLQSRFTRGWQPADWEDMAQEAVLKVITALAKEAVDVSRFDAWFYTVVQNVALDRHRREAGRDGTRVYRSWEAERDNRLDAQDAQDEQRWRAQAQERDNRLDAQGLFVTLCGLDRIVVELTYWYDLTSDEIADVLGEGVSASTVRTWHSNALRKLRASAQEG